jgi:BMFP domain-containing protein YqiC
MVLAAQWKADRDVSDESAGAQDGVDDVRQELEQLRERMAVIKQEAADDVNQKWESPYRTKEVFDLKVQTRLSGNNEYRKLRARIQEVEARLAAESGTAGI